MFSMQSASTTITKTSQNFLLGPHGCMSVCTPSDLQLTYDSRTN
uniref:Uncharacterized protein n=1 Tax=Arundo donax TaxID=35708 RepID=A0A0A9TKN1_ARUDO